jgi:hypothetical protein
MASPIWTTVGRSRATHRGVAQRPGRGVTRPARPRAPNRRLPAARADNPPRAPISAVLTGARGDYARCAAPPPPFRGRPRSCSADTAKSCSKTAATTPSQGPGDHQDDPDRVEVEPRGGDVHREGQDGPHHQQKDADSKAHPRWVLPADGYLSGGRHVQSGGGVLPAVAARLDPVAGSRAIAAVVTRPRTSSQWFAGPA